MNQIILQFACMTAMVRAIEVVILAVLRMSFCYCIEKALKAITEHIASTIL